MSRKSHVRVDNGVSIAQLSEALLVSITMRKNKMENFEVPTNVESATTDNTINLAALYECGPGQVLVSDPKDCYTSNADLPELKLFDSNTELAARTHKNGQTERDNLLDKRFG